MIDPKDYFRYDPNTGYIYWDSLYGRNNKTEIGDVLVTKSHGYFRVKLAGKTYEAHRLAWYLYYGEWPKGQIDHINRVKDDNRIENLRVVDHRGNSHNRESFNGGVSFRTDRNKWISRVRHNGSRKHLGFFDTKEEAINAYTLYVGKLNNVIEDASSNS